MPCNTYLIPAGKLFFAPHPATAEHYLGETPGAELSVDIKSVEVHGSDLPVAELIDEIPFGVARELSFKCINPSDNVIGWFFGADAATLTQTAGSVTNEAFDDVETGVYYPLGVSATNPTGVRDIDTVVVTDDTSPTPVTFDEDDDYTVDLALGRLYIVPGGAITAGKNLRVDYATNAVTRTQHAATPDLAARLCGALRLVANNTSGPNRDLYAPKCVLRADGSVTVKRAQQDGKLTEFGFKVRFQQTSEDLAAVYIDGRAVTA